MVCFSRRKLLSAVVIFLLIAGAVLFFCLRSGQGPTGIYLDGNDGRVAYLEKLGWQVEPEPVQTQQVRVPEEPGEVFLRYNELQLSQGYDLLQYSGRELTRYVDRITNYPAEGSYYATRLVKDGEIVGADVASSAKDGVMHGLNMPS